MIKKITQGFIISLSLFIFGLAMYIIIFGSIAFKNGEVFYIFGYSYATVPTPSMVGDYEDSFNQGSIVFLKYQDFDTLEHRDVVVFKSTTEPVLIVHRLYEENGVYRTKGDANNYYDDEKGEVFNENNYQGVVVGHIKSLYISNLLSGSKGTIMMGASLVLLLVVFYNIYQVMKIIYKHKNEQEKQKNEEILKKEVENMFKSGKNIDS